MDPLPGGSHNQVFHKISLQILLTFMSSPPSPVFNREQPGWHERPEWIHSASLEAWKGTTESREETKSALELPTMRLKEEGGICSKPC